MRPSLSRVPGLFLCVALAIAPQSAWAAPVRTNLGQSQTTVNEVRWQPIPKTETVNGEWEVVDSSNWVKKSQPSPMLAKFQEYRRDYYRRLTTTYPLESKEQRVKTTTTQRYVLKTYGEVSTSSTVMVPVTQEVGEWTTTLVDKPVMTTIQVISEEPVLVDVPVPVYKTVTATYSIPGQPILTPFTAPKIQRVAKTETVTKYRTETTSTTQTVYYKGFDYMGNYVEFLDEGKTLSIRGVDPFLFPSHLIMMNMPVILKGGPTPESIPNAQYIGTWRLEEIVAGPNGTDQVAVSLKLYNPDGSHIYDTFGMLKLQGKFKEERTITSTKQVPYTESVTTYVDTPVATPFSIQVEHLTSKPTDMAGAPVTQGVFWRHHHGPGITCGYRPPQVKNRYVPGIGYRQDRSEVSAGQAAPIVGKLAERIGALDPDAQKVFTLAAHHTNVLPAFQDDASAATVGTRPETVIDHYDTKKEWRTEAHLVSKQVPVQTVLRWKPLPLGATYPHTHDDPVYRCENKYLKTSPSGLAQSSGGAYRPGSGYQTVSTGGSTIYQHTMEPVFGPLYEKVATDTWATKSITVMEPRTVTSTTSVLVSTVPGEDVSYTVSPWFPTGEQRRVLPGTSTAATRSEDVPLRAWLQDYTVIAPYDAPPLKAQSAIYVSDRNAGGTRQAISGTALRKALKTSTVVPSVAKQAQPTQGSVGGTWDEEPIVEERDESIRLSEDGKPITTQQDRTVITERLGQKPTWTPSSQNGKWRKKKMTLNGVFVYYWKWTDR